MRIKNQKYLDNLAMKGRYINSSRHSPEFMDKNKKRRNQCPRLKSNGPMQRIVCLAHRSTRFLIEFMVSPLICDSNITPGDARCYYDSALTGLFKTKF